LLVTNIIITEKARRLSLLDLWLLALYK